jgi:hypothetical protein
MSRGLWHEHAATPRQQRLVFSTVTARIRQRVRTTQADLLLGMLRSARASQKSLSLPEIMCAGIAQHGARFHELRSRGFVIANETERTQDGRVLSRYVLRHDPEIDSPNSSDSEGHK